MGTYLSGDGMVLSDGSWQFCAMCDAAAYVGDPIEHGLGCPKGGSAPAKTPRPTNDPNLYVMTPNGIEKAMDVERRKRR